MKTDDLITRLSAEVAPVRPHAVVRILAGGLATGGFVSFAVIVMALGLRRDMAHVVQHWDYWAKFAYPLALAVFGFWSVERLSRPGVRADRPLLLEIVPFALMVIAAIAQWAAAAPSEHAALLFGHSYLICPWLIVTVSLPVFAGTVWSMRRLAPTRPVLAGAAAGLLSGAAGAWIYALCCNETSLVFVALWYTAGIALMTALGALTGRWMLKW